MKGIILAGGSGTRLYPITKSVSKHLLPVYDKPMIYYPLSVLLLIGIKEILIISTPKDIDQYRNLLEDGNKLGISFSYAIQEKPKGIPEAFIIGEDFIGSDKVALILGDNIFYGQGFSLILRKASNFEKGAVIFGYYMQDPRSFGVVEVDFETKKAISIEEKPKTPKSKFAVPGLYLYDNRVIKLAKNLKPSERGELEITSLNNEYLKQDNLKVELFGRGLAWFDTGSHERLLAASNFVEAIQKRQGLYIACIEEIVYRLGYIDSKQLKELAKPLNNTEYGQYLLALLKNDNRFITLTNYGD